MAQPVFDDEGPLDEYLRDTELDFIPGSIPEFVQVTDTSSDPALWIPSPILDILHSFESLFYPPPNRISTRQFAERFKYIIISSSLLSAFLSPASSVVVHAPDSETHTPSDVSNAQITTLALFLYAISSLLLARGNWILATAAFLLAYHVSESAPSQDGNKPLQTRSTLQALEHLVDADSAWESAVREAMELLSRDDSSGLIQWQTPLRVALQSSLQAITTQADRVRQLFSPLTSPIELGQLSEMYAPPSPTNTHQSLATQQSSPTSNLRRTPSNSKLNKRITWSGPTSRQMARRSIDPNTLSPRPHSPIPPVPPLPSPNSHLFDTPSSASFGALALDLERNKVTPQRHSLSATRSAGSLRPSPTASTRFTTMQSMRNPLSMHSLDIILQTALSSKRFTCAHLLALRFDEEEDDFYWEDVRSVMALLSTSLEDESSRLSEAMDEWHRNRLRDSRPSVTSTPSPSPKESTMPTNLLPPRKRREPISFAPQSTNAAKMVAHVKSISCALDQAYDNLENCASLIQQYDDNSDVEAAAMDTIEASAQLVMTAYEALRRELGLALRECERARSPLLAILTSHSQDDNAPEDTSADLDLSDRDSTIAEDSFPLDSPSRAGAGSPPPAYVSRGPSQIVDDVTAHLLAGATATGLPPPGAERVFEADSETTVGVYKKKRSSLSREQRIALAQAKRRLARSLISGDGSVDHQDQPSQPSPMGSDVVEELKQVIGLVNARKQRMAVLPLRKDQSTAMDHFSPSSLETVLPSH
ncbi:hypothetical protein CPB86DRAFT_743722 [Serendipita vermifera]|nr:hypothetical protein CPB86DRAFT_743722 [Serendipita vermifera]